MQGLVALSCDSAAPERTATALLEALQRRGWVRLVGPQHGSEAPLLQQPSALWPEGPGLVLSTGGSSGGRSLCLHPLTNLERSAEVCGQWLHRLGLDPETCLVWNPLPFQHVSGLMPWWRARQWGASHAWLAPDLMKQASSLLGHCRQHPGWRQRPMLLSLVPTQLRRLLTHPEGCSWLQAMDVIWVGGAALPLDLAALSRQAALRLAPCYGATETAAMVTVQTPQAFLAGHRSCGNLSRVCVCGWIPMEHWLCIATVWLWPGLIRLEACNRWWMSRGGGAPAIWRCLAAIRSLLTCRLWVAAMVPCSPAASPSFLRSWRNVCWCLRIGLDCLSRRC